MVKKDNTRLVVYTLQNCIYCNDLKGKLNTLGLEYKEIIIDDGNPNNNFIGNRIEKLYKTESYPILKYFKNWPNDKLYIISKTDLEEQEGIYIFETIDQIINKLKELYAL